MRRAGSRMRDPANRAHAPVGSTRRRAQRTTDARRVRTGVMRDEATFRVKSGLAEMLKGGVIMDVVTPEQALSPRRPEPPP